MPDTIARPEATKTEQDAAAITTPVAQNLENVELTWGSPESLVNSIRIRKLPESGNLEATIIAANAWPESLENLPRQLTEAGYSVHSGQEKDSFGEPMQVLYVKGFKQSQELIGQLENLGAVKGQSVAVELTQKGERKKKLNPMKLSGALAVVGHSAIIARGAKQAISSKLYKANPALQKHEFKAGLMTMAAGTFYALANAIYMKYGSGRPGQEMVRAREDMQKALVKAGIDLPEGMYQKPKNMRGGLFEKFKDNPITWVNAAGIMGNAAFTMAGSAIGKKPDEHRIEMSDYSETLKGQKGLDGDLVAEKIHEIENPKPYELPENAKPWRKVTFALFNMEGLITQIGGIASLLGGIWAVISKAPAHVDPRKTTDANGLNIQSEEAQKPQGFIAKVKHYIVNNPMKLVAAGNMTNDLGQIGILGAKIEKSARASQKIAEYKTKSGLNDTQLAEDETFQLLKAKAGSSKTEAQFAAMTATFWGAASGISFAAEREAKPDLQADEMQNLLINDAARIVRKLPEEQHNYATKALSVYLANRPDVILSTEELTHAINDRRESLNFSPFETINRKPEENSATAAPDKIEHITRHNDADKTKAIETSAPKEDLTVDDILNAPKTIDAEHKDLMDREESKKSATVSQIKPKEKSFSARVAEPKTTQVENAMERRQKEQAHVAGLGA